MLDAPPRRGAAPPKERRIGRIVLPIVIVVLVVAVISAGAFYNWATGASGPENPVVVVIPSGATGSEVATLLHDKGVIRSALGFKLLARFKHSGAFEAGEYHLTTNMTASDALGALEQPPAIPQVRLTIPEGFNVSQTAVRVASVFSITPKAFSQAATAGTYSLPPYLPKGTPTVEGFLFPNTYFFFANATSPVVIGKLLTEFKVETQKLDLSGKAKALGLTPYQVVVAASLIEEEARFPQDRPKVAAVIYNRMRAGMRLQFDSTVQYALGQPKPSLTFADLRIKSPYNTYLHTGLPPTPISSPGLASLSAALNPTSANYLYFIAIDKAGHEAFTASYQEFLRLKAQSGA